MRFLFFILFLLEISSSLDATEQPPRLNRFERDMAAPAATTTRRDRHDYVPFYTAEEEAYWRVHHIFPGGSVRAPQIRNQRVHVPSELRPPIVTAWGVEWPDDSETSSTDTSSSPETPSRSSSCSRELFIAELDGGRSERAADIHLAFRLSPEQRARAVVYGGDL